MFRVLVCSIAIAFSGNIFAADASQPEIRKLTPPQLKPQNIKRPTFCVRPCREGGPALNLYKKDGKIIVNHYGLGGAGWSLAPGSAKHVVDLLERENVDKYTPITIAGSGVAGLFTALELYKRNFEDVTLVAESFFGLTSHKAAGLFCPHLLYVNASDPELITKLGKESYRYYRSLIDRKVHDFTEEYTAKSFKLLPTYFSKNDTCGYEAYIPELMSPGKDVIVDFGNGAEHEMVVYDEGLFIDTSNAMRALHHKLRRTHIGFVKKHIESLDQLHTPVVINCLGANAEVLNKDDKLVPVLGHLILLKNQNPDKLNYQIASFDSKDTSEEGLPITRTMYFMPKTDFDNADEDDVGVIGGTFITGANELSPHDSEFQGLLSRAKVFFGLSDSSLDIARR